nr:MAG: ORF1 [TTV-like mini virus]
MPWRRRRRWWRPKRWRRYYWRRPRKTLRRRYYSRRVRKLKRLNIRQWQPSTIRLCKVKGLTPLFLCNTHRLGHNLPMYNTSIVPEKLPGGGGFSIYQYTIENLYTMHQYVRNWWTKSNKDLPLVRFVKCTLKLYQSEDVDYVFRYQRHYPMTTGILNYNTTQPSVLMMLNHTKFIPSKKTKKIRRGYKKLTIRPPELMTNKWFFQSDIADKPLLVTYCTACSFDHYYIATDRMSNNTTIPILNANLVQNRNFGTNRYFIQNLGTTHVWLYATDDVVSLRPPTDQPLASHVIPLTNCKYHRPGKSYQQVKSEKLFPNEIQSQSDTKKWEYYLQHIDDYAGNLFHEYYLTKLDEEHLTLFQYTNATLTIPTKDNIVETTHPFKPTESRTKDLVAVHNPLIYFTRYNPNTDNGSSNKTFLLETCKYNLHGWDPPPNPKLISEGLPLYILWWGFVDFQKQQHILTKIDTNSLLATQTNTLHGAASTQVAHIPLSTDFINGRSPYESTVNIADIDRWYPMIQYQEQAINDLLSTGPGVAKFNGKKTVEAKMEYIFYFKFGGTPAPMVDVKDPTNQPSFVIPNNFMDTNSLQDPTTPPEYFLYNFDQRREMLTKAAAERIIKNWDTKKSMFSDGTTTAGTPKIHQTLQTSDEETSDSEKEEATLLEKLLKQRRKQQKLKLRIRQLMQQQTTNLE